MRVLRSLLKDPKREQIFHVVSRIVDRRMVFGDTEKRVFVEMMRRYEGFCGVRVLAYSVMGNHFHILVQMTARPETMDEMEVWRRMKYLYEDDRIREFEEGIREWETLGFNERSAEFFEGMRNRMHDLSIFVQELKQRFSKWYNNRKQRKGTLWEDRFRSVLLGGDEGAILAVAAYIDLNAVRAGIVSAPQEYEWCSFGEAMAGGRLARQGLIQVFSGRGGKIRWEKVKIYYSEVLNGRRNAGHERKEGVGMVKNEVRDNVCCEGQMLAQISNIIKSRIRYFTDGLIVGSREFIEEFYCDRLIGVFPDRKTICKKIPGGKLGGINSYRDVRVKAK